MSLNYLENFRNLQEMKEKRGEMSPKSRRVLGKASKVLHAAYILNVYRCPAKSASRSLLEMLQ
jgi:hypothetical protein